MLRYNDKMTIELYTFVYFNWNIPRIKDPKFWSSMILYMSLNNIYTINGRKIRILDIFKELEESIMVQEMGKPETLHGFLFDSWLNTKGEPHNPNDSKWEFRFKMLQYHYEKRFNYGKKNRN